MNDTKTTAEDVIREFDNKLAPVIERLRNGQHNFHDIEVLGTWFAAMKITIEQLCEEKDAYGDTLAMIAEQPITDEQKIGPNPPPQVMAGMVLAQRGYIPFGRVKTLQQLVELHEHAIEKIAELDFSDVTGYAAHTTIMGILNGENNG